MQGMAGLGAPLLILQTFLRFFPDPLNERFLLRETEISVRQLRRVLNRLAQARLLHSIRKEGLTFYRLNLDQVPPSLTSLVSEFAREEVHLVETLQKQDVRLSLLQQTLREKEQESLQTSSRFVTYLNALVFLEEISPIVSQCQSFDQVFRESFRGLSSAVNYDVGIAVLVEEKLNLHILRKKGIDDLRLHTAIEAVREMMGPVFMLPYLMQEVAVVEDVEEQEPAPPGPPIHRIGAVFQKDSMTPGYLALLRLEDRPFLEDEKQVLEVLATQIALACRNIAALQKIRQMAQKDDLIGIYTQRYFREVLAREFERARRYAFPLALLMMDLDHFKNVNDRHGHQVGDVVLSEFAALVLPLTRSSDVFARVGGEEFALLLPHTEGYEAVEIAERIRRQTEATAFPGEDAPVYCTVSVGVGINGFPVPSPEDLLSLADANLHRAKANGRNLVIWGL